MVKALSKEIHEIIVKNYPLKTPAEVAQMVGMKKENVIAYAYRHKISGNRYWTKEEEEYLETHYGTMTACAIAKRLGKTTESVVTKAYKKNIGGFLDNAEEMHLAEICRLVGRDKETIKRTWVKYGLKIRKKGKYTMINEKDLAEFMNF